MLALFGVGLYFLTRGSLNATVASASVITAINVVPDRCDVELGFRPLPGLSSQEIAERVGASRDMVSRIFRDLTAGGYITVENRFITINKKPPARW